MGRRQNRNDSTRCSGNIQRCANISTFISLVVFQGVLKAIRANVGNPALSRGDRKGNRMAAYGKGPSGPSLLRPCSAPGGFPLRSLWAPSTSAGFLRRSPGAPSTLACWVFHVGTYGVPDGLAGCSLWDPRAPPESRFSKQQDGFSKPEKTI